MLFWTLFSLQKMIVVYIFAMFCYIITIMESLLNSINTGLATLTSAVGAVKDKKFIRQENQKARDFSLEMWNKTNEYNSPQAQMDRFVSAGLNPNLIYGDGASTLAQYVGSPGHSAPNMQSGKNVADSMQKGVTLSQQQQINDSAIELNKSVATLNDQKSKGEQIENTYKGAIRKKELEGKGLENEAQEIENIVNGDSAVITARQGGIIADTEIKGFQKEIYSLEKALKDKDIEKATEIINNLKKEGELIDEQKKTEQAKQTSLRASATESLAMARQLDQLTPLMRQKLASEIKINKEMVHKVMADTGLSYANAYKMLVDGAEALRNGKTERFIKLWNFNGNNTAGTVLNFMYNSLGILESGATLNSDSNFVPSVRYPKKKAPGYTGSW